MSEGILTAEQQRAIEYVRQGEVIRLLAEVRAGRITPGDAGMAFDYNERGSRFRRWLCSVWAFCRPKGGTTTWRGPSAILLCLGLCHGVLAAECVDLFVSPTGRAGAAGTVADPLSLVAAFAKTGPVRPGQTLWLRGGTYSVPGALLVGANVVPPFTSHLTGSAESPIIVRQFSGERATIDGGITVYGAWATYWGFEVTNSHLDRGKPRPTGLEVFGAHTKFVNLVVHDCGQGFGFWRQATDSEISGCLVYNNGYSAPDRLHGHAIYTQNEVGTKRIADNVIFNSFVMGVHLHGSQSEWTFRNYTLEGNVHFNSAFSIGTNPALENIVLTENYNYYAGMAIGQAINNQDVTLTGNYSVAIKPFYFQGWQEIEAADNTGVALLDSQSTIVGIILPTGVEVADYDIDGNTYHNLNTNNRFWTRDTGVDTLFSFSQWQALGADAASTYSGARPVGADVFVRPNAYESGRGHVIVYNWDLDDTVAVDVSSVLALGASYEVRDAQNYFGDPVLSGVYAGGTLALPMDLTVLSPLVGVAPGFSKVHTPKEFNAFVILTV